MFIAHISANDMGNLMVQLTSGVHPGLQLAALLSSWRINTFAFADALRVRRSKLGAVLSGEAPVSFELAHKLEALVGVKAARWLEVQLDFDKLAMDPVDVDATARLPTWFWGRSVATFKFGSGSLVQLGFNPQGSLTLVAARYGLAEVFSDEEYRQIFSELTAVMQARQEKGAELVLLHQDQLGFMFFVEKFYFDTGSPFSQVSLEQLVSGSGLKVLEYYQLTAEGKACGTEIRFNRNARRQNSDWMYDATIQAWVGDLGTQEMRGSMAQQESWLKAAFERSIEPTSTLEGLHDD